MSYISLSDKDKKEMLSRIGVSSIDELFRSIPDSVRLKNAMKIPEAMTEPELIDHFVKAAEKNTYHRYLSFLGAGAYNHFIPSVVDYLSARGEFISPYTPYQAELSQGTLQVIFEFQTLVCMLTGMDISNASLYDGASGAAEAVLMAHRLKKKPTVLVAKSLHPQYRSVIQTYAQRLDVKIEELHYQDTGELDVSELSNKLDDTVTAVVVQSPNFFGIIEDLECIAALAHKKQALLIDVVTEPVSLGILEAPGNLGADIVTGEGQSFGIPLSYGGPYLGFMACAKEFVRQFPGRIAGQTQDKEGKRGFVLTLSTREQHIKRERATSNICTNQAWCALRATIFLELLGKQGLREMALQNMRNSRYAFSCLKELKNAKPRFSGNHFNEFVIEFSKPWGEIDDFLKQQNILGGFFIEDFYPELKNCVLFCVTEKHSRDDIDRMVETLKKYEKNTLS